MVTRRNRSEYMKKFKDPKWETYTKCYEEMLKYRLTRRLLEQTHKPWFWSGSDTDSDSGGRSPLPPGKNQVGPEPGGDRAEAEREECEASRMDKAVGAVSRLPLHDDEEEYQGGHREPAKDTGGARQSKPPKSSKQTWRSQQVIPAPAHQPWEDNKDRRHPFALYGSGERDADIAGRKTHNVCPAASTHEIHESALRAKTRRQVERQMQTQRAERRRARSAELSKAKKVVQPKFNPWLTEYMRCFSVRSR
uniref:Centriole, cilia and spindle-associated protein a n=1 Tax=Mola mola TaxID=94237 RepID=A0A3Q3WXC5_MOLML